MEAPSTPPNRLMSLALAAHEAGSRSEPSTSRVQDMPWILDTVPKIRHMVDGQLTPPQSPERVKRPERGIRLPPISTILGGLVPVRRSLPAIDISRSLSWAGHPSVEIFDTITESAGLHQPISLSHRGHQIASSDHVWFQREDRNDSATGIGNSFSSTTSTQAWSSPHMRQGLIQLYSPTSTRAASLRLLSPSRTLSPHLPSHHSSFTSTQASSSRSRAKPKKSDRKEPYDDDELYAMVFIKDMTLSWSSILQHFDTLFPPGVERRCSNKSAKRCSPLYVKRSLGAIQCRLYRARTKLRLEPLREEKTGQANEKQKKQDTRKGAKSAALSSLSSAKGKHKQYRKPKDALEGLVAQGRVSPEVVRLCHVIAERSRPMRSS